MQEIEQDLPLEKRSIPHGSTAVKGLMFTSLVLAIVVATRNPMTGGPKVILTFLGLLFLVLSNLFALVLQLIWRITNRGDYSWVQLLYCSITLAFGVVFLIGLQTLGQLRIIDAALVVVFETVLLFYIIRRF